MLFVNGENVRHRDDGDVAFEAGVGGLRNVPERSRAKFRRFAAAPGVRASLDSNRIGMPGVCARSRMAAVGRPPLQKNASILPSFSASADCATPRLCFWISVAGLMPTAFENSEGRHLAAAAGGAGRDHLALRSASVLIGLDASVTT